MSLVYKRLMERSLYARYIYFLIDDVRQQYRYKRGNIGSSSGMRHTRKTTQESVDYIDGVFEDYKNYGDIGSFCGKVAELGPGDNIGVALRLLADGASTVDLVDRFSAFRSIENNANITRYYFTRYPQLVDRFGDINVKRDDELESLENVFGDSIRRFTGDGAAAEQYFKEGQAYDWIVSRSVLEHLYNPEMALQSMVKALKVGGRMIHKVDLRDHGLFSDLSHELKFLELPKWIYQRMTTASGRPNRILVDAYRKSIERLQVNYKVLVTRLVGVGEVLPHRPLQDIPLSIREKSMEIVELVRPSLATSFRDVDTADLMVSGFYIMASKNRNL